KDEKQGAQAASAGANGTSSPSTILSRVSNSPNFDSSRSGKTIFSCSRAN
ncbi:hypothetical protein A2U01_0058322, partial [Trifolium medium]|nr:hypothetical protein [Trifolium medium]